MPGPTPGTLDSRIINRTNPADLAASLQRILAGPPKRAAATLRAARGGDFRGQFNTARMLLDRGDRATALPWLRRVPQSATPAFLAQASRWLRRRGDPSLLAIAKAYDHPGLQEAHDADHA